MGTKKPWKEIPGRYFEFGKKKNKGMFYSIRFKR